MLQSCELVNLTSDRTVPIALREDGVKFELLKEKKRWADISKAFKLMGRRFEIINMEGVGTELKDRVIHLNKHLCTVLSCLIQYFFKIV